MTGVGTPPPVDAPPADPVGDIAEGAMGSPATGPRRDDPISQPATIRSAATPQLARINMEMMSRFQSLLLTAAIQNGCTWVASLAA
jgi:hypothetical protein